MSLISISYSLFNAVTDIEREGRTARIVFGGIKIVVHSFGPDDFGLAVHFNSFEWVLCDHNFTNHFWL